jgi:hypothetical protein
MRLFFNVSLYWVVNRATPAWAVFQKLCDLVGPFLFLLRSGKRFWVWAPQTLPKFYVTILLFSGYAEYIFNAVVLSNKRGKVAVVVALVSNFVALDWQDAKLNWFGAVFLMPSLLLPLVALGKRKSLRELLRFYFKLVSICRICKNWCLKIGKKGPAHK